MAIKKKSKSFIAYMDYDKEFGVFHETIYFKRPTTRHVYADIVAKKVRVTEVK